MRGSFKFLQSSAYLDFPTAVLLSFTVFFFFFFTIESRLALATIISTRNRWIIESWKFSVPWIFLKKNRIELVFLFLFVFLFLQSHTIAFSSRCFHVRLDFTKTTINIALSFAENFEVIYRQSRHTTYSFVLHRVFKPRTTAKHVSTCLKLCRPSILLFGPFPLHWV